jgi:hypothetical protein
VPGSNTCRFSEAILDALPVSLYVVDRGLSDRYMEQSIEKSGAIGFIPREVSDRARCL